MLFAGQVYQATLKVGDGTVPAGTATLTVTRPDGTTTVFSNVTPSPAGTGNYLVNYTLDIPGLYQFAWVTTSPGTAPLPDMINVRRFASIVSMAEMKAHLNITRTGMEDELAAFMMAATELVESKVGIIVPRTFTDRAEEGRWRLLVDHKPVLSVTRVASVWAGGPSWDNTLTPGVLAADAEAGIIYQPSQFEFWWGPWDVTYQAGRREIAERWSQAAKEQTRHLWETQRGSMPPALLQGEETFSSTTGFTFSVPRRVLELLEEDTVPSS